MERLYKYRGTVSSISFNASGCGTADLVLGDRSDWDRPPVRVTAHGALARYINAIEGTDAEERYIHSEWYYDRTLFLHRIEVPSNNERVPAKVIVQAGFLSNELVIFEPQDYIETDSPEPMDRDQRAAWRKYRFNLC